MRALKEHPSDWALAFSSKNCFSVRAKETILVLLLFTNTFLNCLTAFSTFAQTIKIKSFFNIADISCPKRLKGGKRRKKSG
jgi:hypothetical protein